MRSAPRKTPNFPLDIRNVPGWPSYPALQQFSFFESPHGSLLVGFGNEGFDLPIAGRAHQGS